MKIRTKAVYDALKEAGTCVRCAKRQAIPGMTMCDPCNEHRTEQNRQQAQRAAEQGFCYRHRHKKVVPTYRSCILCLMHDRARKRRAGKAA